MTQNQEEEKICVSERLFLSWEERSEAWPWGCTGSCEDTGQAEQVRKDGSGAQGPRSDQRTDSILGGSPASHRNMWQDLAAGPSRPSTPCSRSLTGAGPFCHRVQFPCGIFVSTFYGFKESDNTGRERHLEPRTRIEFPMKIATLQEGLFPSFPCRPYPNRLQRGGGSNSGWPMWLVSWTPGKHLIAE